MGSGSVIHAMSDEQDMRKMGGLYPHIKITWWMMLIGTIALTGFGIPGIGGTAGFYSKDAIIEATYAAHSGVGTYAFWLTVLAALMTSFYSWRLMFMTFHGKEPRLQGSDEPRARVAQCDADPALSPGVGALLAGVSFAPYFIGHHEAEFWGLSLFHVRKATTSSTNMHNVPLWVKFSATVMMVAGFVLAWLMYIKNTELPRRLAEQHALAYKFLLNKWYFDEIYDFLFVRPAMWLGRFLWKPG